MHPRRPDMASGWSKTAQDVPDPPRLPKTPPRGLSLFLFSPSLSPLPPDVFPGGFPNRLGEHMAR
eukprot:4872180-Pyramimonas_sp.AAC.1